MIQWKVQNNCADTDTQTRMYIRSYTTEYKIKQIKSKWNEMKEKRERETQFRSIISFQFEIIILSEWKESRQISERAILQWAEAERMEIIMIVNNFMLYTHHEGEKRELCEPSWERERIIEICRVKKKIIGFM